MKVSERESECVSVSQSVCEYVCEQMNELDSKRVREREKASQSVGE